MQQGGLYNNQGFNNYSNQQGFNNGFNGYNNMGGMGGFINPNNNMNNNLNNNMKQPPIPFNQNNINRIFYHLFRNYC